MTLVSFFQINEVLKLLNELLPTIGAEDDGHQKSEKEDFLLNHPDILHKFGVDLLPILIQVGIRHSYLIFLSMHFPPQSLIVISPSSRW